MLAVVVGCCIALDFESKHPARCRAQDSLECNVPLLGLPHATSFCLKIPDLIFPQLDPATVPALTQSSLKAQREVKSIDVIVAVHMGVAHAVTV